jgi:hypothetical protein
VNLLQQAAGASDYFSSLTAKDSAVSCGVLYLALLRDLVELINFIISILC